MCLFKIGFLVESTYFLTVAFKVQSYNPCLLFADVEFLSSLRFVCLYLDSLSYCLLFGPAILHSTLFFSCFTTKCSIITHLQLYSGEFLFSLKSLWGRIAQLGHTPLKSQTTLPQAQLRLSENSYLYIMVHHRSRVIVMKQQQKQFYGWGSPQHEKLLNGHSIGKVGNHWSRGPAV